MHFFFPSGKKTLAYQLNTTKVTIVVKFLKQRHVEIIPSIQRAREEIN